MNKLKENFKQDKMGFAANLIGIILCFIVIPFIGKEGYSFIQSLQANSDVVAVNEYESIQANNEADTESVNIVEKDISIKGYSEGNYIVSNINGNEYYAMTPKNGDGLTGVMFVSEQIMGEVQEGNKVTVKYMNDEIISVQRVSDDVYVMAEDGSYVIGEVYYD